MHESAREGDTVRVHYKGRLDDGSIFDTSEGQDPIEFTQVPGPQACTGGAFYFDGDAVILCPETCVAVQQEGAALELAFACLPLQPG